MTASAEPLARGWLARLELGFAVEDGRTRLVHRRHHGPLLVQRTFHPEGEVCHAYLIHPPGGVVGGDRLELALECRRGARALITTPAAGKFYRSAGGWAALQQRLAVAAGAALEWLPQEQIVFQGAKVDALTRVDLAVGAGFIGWEIACLGRPASDEGFGDGMLRQRFELWRDGRPLLLERLRLQGGGPELSAAWGLGGASVLGTLVAVGADGAAEELARAAAGERAAVTRLGDVLVARYLGHGAERAREVFADVWAALRPVLFGREACAPRIWTT